MIGILTVSHNRPKIDEAYCLMIDRLTRDYPNTFLPIATVSVEEEMETFKNHGIEVYQYKNNPVGEKHNFTINKFRDRVSHIIHLGSDDIIDNNYINEILKHQGVNIAWGIGVYFYDTQNKVARFWDAPYRQVAGPAKIISAELLDKCNWHIWDDTINSGLDHSCWKGMLPHIGSQATFRVKDINGLMVDLKSETNINLYRPFSTIGNQIEAEFIYNKISKPEADYLRSL